VADQVTGDDVLGIPPVGSGSATGTLPPTGAFAYAYVVQAPMQARALDGIGNLEALADRDGVVATMVNRTAGDAPTGGSGQAWAAARDWATSSPTMEAMAASAASACSSVVPMKGPNAAWPMM